MTQANYLVIACAAFATGIWQASLFTWQPAWLIGIAAVLLVIALRRLAAGSPRTLPPICCLFFVAGILCYQQATLLRSDDISHYANQTVTLTGTVIAIPEIVSDSEQQRVLRYVLLAEQVQPFAAAGLPASGKLRLTVLDRPALPESALPAAYGDKIIVTGKLWELHGYNNPGQLDVVTALTRQGITARMSVQTQNLKVLTFHQGDSWQQTLANWRSSSITALQQVMPLNDAAVLSALLFGGYQGIHKEVIRDFQTTGLIHILSVSGAHIALVSGLILCLGKRLRCPAPAALILAVAAISFYAGLSGLTPPVIRATLMGLISLLAIVLERDSHARSALAVTGLIMLLMQPQLLFDISFQLSFGATAGLLLLYQPTLTYLSRWPSWLAGPFAVTLAAQLGVLPVLAWYFNAISLIALAANLLVLPVIEMVILLGLAGVISYPLVPLVAKIIFVLSSLLIGTALQLTRLLASVPYASVYLPSAELAGSLLYYVLLAWIYGYLPLRLPTPRELLAGYPRYCLGAAIASAALFSLTAWIPQPLTVHFIDVGQGDAALIITPHNHAVLVDAGGTLGESDFDIGERVVAPYLKHYGIRKLDYLILTHGHQDHAGGAAGVARSIPIHTLLLPQAAYSPAVRELLRVCPEAAVIIAYSQQQFQLDNVLFTVEQALGERSGGRRPAEKNEASSVIRVSLGQHSFLLTGDLEEQGEAALLTNAPAPCTVLKVGHHGARTATTESLLQALTPQFAVISAGYGNRYGHPHPETLQRLSAKQVTIYRTDRQGAIVFHTDGKTLGVKPYVQ